MLANKKTVLSTVTDDIATYVDNLGRSVGGHHDNLTLAIVETKKNSKMKKESFISKILKTKLKITTKK